MSTYEAPGLTADWLNGWLAAIGVTVLLPDVSLSWSYDAMPYARFHCPDGWDLVGSLVERLPTERSLAGSTIARKLVGTTHEFTRNVTIEAFRERAMLERERHSHHLAASVTDLRADRDLDLLNLPHGAFDPPAPRGETLWSRATACVEKLGADGALTGQIDRSLRGMGRREQVNGLGFDSRRLSSGMQSSGATSKVHADPVVELLCFEALVMFPLRGNGRLVRQRGWIGRESKRGSFRWPAWKPVLDRWAIDALLDQVPMSAARAQVVAAYEVIPYQPGGTSDTTRAYFSTRVS